MKKYCLITGASGDIGAAISKKMAAQGFSLYLHYFRNFDKVQKVKTDCERLGVSVQVIQANLAEECSVETIVRQLHHPIDAFVYTSGNSYVGLLTDMSNQEIKDMLQLHLQTPILLTKAILPEMVKRKEGSLVFISSIWGLTGASCEVVYSAVKGGINSFVKALAKELAPSNIRVNGVAPGAIATKMLNYFTEEDKLQLIEDIPLGRLGKPEEVADTVSFLHSNQASYITGQIISINGAWYT